MQYQFQVDGRPGGPVRTVWDHAAQDAVDAGYAVWNGNDQIKLDATQGAAIARSYGNAKPSGQ